MCRSCAPSYFLSLEMTFFYHWVGTNEAQKLHSGDVPALPVYSSKGVSKSFYIPILIIMPACFPCIKVPRRYAVCWRQFWIKSVAHHNTPPGGAACFPKDLLRCSCSLAMSIKELGPLPKGSLSLEKAVGCFLLAFMENKAFRVKAEGRCPGFSSSSHFSPS